MTCKDENTKLHNLLHKYILFIVASIYFHIFGPWVYIGENVWILMAFMLIFILVITYGYRLGLKKEVTISPHHSIANQTLFRLFSLSLLLAILIKGLVFAANATSPGGSPFSSSAFSVGRIYAEAISRARGMVGTSLIVQIETLCGFFSQMAIIGGFYYYARLKTLLRAIFIALLIIIFTNALLFRGTQIAFGSILIYAFSVMTIISMRKDRTIVDKKIILMGAAALLLFAWFQASRLDAYGVSFENFPLNPLIKINKEHWIFAIFGTSFGFVLAIMAQYFCMGYFGLSQCLQLDFVWTYGLGNSMAISSYANQYFGVAEQLQNSYPLRLEAINGWPALMYWQTIFPWLAGDFTWAGTLLIFGGLAYIYAISIKEAIYHDNFLSMMVVTNLNVMWLFVPANNQLMQTRESAITVLILMFLWLCSHRRFNRPTSDLTQTEPKRR